MIYYNHKFLSMAKRRRYSKCHLNIGFTIVLAKDGIEKPRCVLCHAVLNAANETTEPRVISRRNILNTKRRIWISSNGMNGDLKARLDVGESFQQQSAAIMEAS